MATLAKTSWDTCGHRGRKDASLSKIPMKSLKKVWKSYQKRPFLLSDLLLHPPPQPHPRNVGPLYPARDSLTPLWREQKRKFMD